MWRRGPASAVEPGARRRAPSSVVLGEQHPLEGEGYEIAPGTCIKTGKPSAQRVLFAKNY